MVAVIFRFDLKVRLKRVKVKKDWEGEKALTLAVAEQRLDLN